MHLLPLLPLLPLAFASPLQQIPFLSSSPTSYSSHSSSNDSRTLVPLSLGVMSRCPDAEICETLIDRVLDTHTSRTGREVVGDLVQLKLIYLAKENATNGDATYGGLSCLHGPLECSANVQQLCAASHWKVTPSLLEEEFEAMNAEKGRGVWKDWWNFVQCMNWGKREDVGKESTAKSCAKVVGREWTKELEECSVDSPDSEGAKLFKKSVELSRKLRIEKSCSILLGSRKICVHDGTWKECENGHEVGDFVQQIQKEYARLNSHAKVGSLDHEEEEQGDWLFV
ncbi:uncharacterized protein JCM6883_005878 [Sporobolomyces salmoneus]|uniref:uncharacterized protein n=1 Tax=Sporobolomyces salmoneus TaxID=183962 RepID=UPI00317EA656